MSTVMNAHKNNMSALINMCAAPMNLEVFESEAAGTKCV
jgi:hypothetical protein